MFHYLTHSMYIQRQIALVKILSACNIRALRKHAFRFSEHDCSQTIRILSVSI